MTGTMHSMFDGTTKDEDIPTIRISAEEETGKLMEDRHEVVLKIEALDNEIADEVECFLRKGFRREAGRFLYLSVFVKDVELFKYNIGVKYDRTSRRWKNTGTIEVWKKYGRYVELRMTRRSFDTVPTRTIRGTSRDATLFWHLCPPGRSHVVVTRNFA